jgi:hypothetical protein
MVEFFSAIFARKNLKLIRNISDLISKEAKKLIVHVTLLENLNEAIVIHLIND